MLARHRAVNAKQYSVFGDPEINTGLPSMNGLPHQTSVRNSWTCRRSRKRARLYGPDVKKPAPSPTTVASPPHRAGCALHLQAFIIAAADQHATFPNASAKQSRDTDQRAPRWSRTSKRAAARRHADRRGASLGRTVYSQGKIEPDNYARDHHGRLLQIMDVRRRYQGAASVTARRRLLLQRGGDPSTFTTRTLLFCTASASTRKVTFRFEVAITG